MKKIIFFASISLLLMGIVTTITFANNFNNDIESFVKNKKENLEALENRKDIVISGVIEGNEFSITKEDYEIYKENIKFVHKMNKLDFIEDIDTLTEQMIQQEVLLAYAKNQGISVSADEILEYAEQTKKFFNDLDKSDEMSQLHEELAKEKNVSREDYFTHPDVLKGYEEMLIVGKLVEQLIEEGEVDFENKTLESFVSKIKEKNNGKIKVDVEKIKNKNSKN
ncbi:hypothetical protein ACEK07_32495 [Alcanivoracaceae bacterium MT1]